MTKLQITPKHPRGADGYKVFSIRIKDDIVERIDNVAEKTGRTRNELIGMLLAFALDNSEVVPERK